MSNGGEYPIAPPAARRFGSCWNRPTTSVNDAMAERLAALAERVGEPMGGPPDRRQRKDKRAA
jgi:hypothetical protein